MAANIILVIAKMPQLKIIPLHDWMTANGLQPKMQRICESALAPFVAELDACNLKLGGQVGATLTDDVAAAEYTVSFWRIFDINPSDVAYVLTDTNYFHLIGPEYSSAEPHLIRTLKALTAAGVGREVAAARNRLGKVLYMTLSGHSLY